MSQIKERIEKLELAHDVITIITKLIFCGLLLSYFGYVVVQVVKNIV